jgi:hypothetical protein
MNLQCSCFTLKKHLHNEQGYTGKHPVRLAYQSPASSIFLSEQINHQQSANSTFLSQQISTSHQPPAKRTDRLRMVI